MISLPHQFWNLLMIFSLMIFDLTGKCVFRFVRTILPFADKVSREKPPNTSPYHLWGNKVCISWFLSCHCIPSMIVFAVMSWTRSACMDLRKLQSVRLPKKLPNMPSCAAISYFCCWLLKYLALAALIVWNFLMILAARSLRWLVIHETWAFYFRDCPSHCRRGTQPACTSQVPWLTS